MSVEFGSVDASEFDLIAYSDTAGTAHAGTIDHHGVERNDGVEPVLLGEQRDAFHHRKRTDSNTAVVVLAALDQVFDFVGDKTFLTVASVVGRNVEVVADAAHTVFKEDEILALGAHDDVAVESETESPLGLGIHRCCTDTAGDKENAETRVLLEEFDNFGGTPEGSDDGEKILALLHISELACRVAYNLEHDGDDIELMIDVADSERNALSACIGDNDEELSGMSAFSNPGSFNVHEDGGRGEKFFLQDSVHVYLGVKGFKDCFSVFCR